MHVVLFGRRTDYKELGGGYSCKRIGWLACVPFVLINILTRQYTKHLLHLLHEYFDAAVHKYLFTFVTWVFWSGSTQSICYMNILTWQYTQHLLHLKLSLFKVWLACWEVECPPANRGKTNMTSDMLNKIQKYTNTKYKFSNIRLGW